MLSPELTLALRSRQSQRPSVSMAWRDLTFLHYACEPSIIQKLLPNGLTVDVFPDGSGELKAWVGLVLFRMERVHPRWLPIVPCGNFPETNVRTYCHRDGKEPGVWFLSLDAANPFACAFARRFYSLPYHEASMRCDRAGGTIEYRSRRWQAPRATTLANAAIGSATAVDPGTLEFFLIERYLLYSARQGTLYKGQVFHAPYQVNEITNWRCDTELLVANHLVTEPFSHAHFSDGVQVVADRIERVS